MAINVKNLILSIFFFCLVYSSSVIGANNTIPLTIEAGSGATLLVLPVPNDTIPVNSTVSIQYKDIPIDASFHIATLWPNTQSDSYIRTLLIESAELKDFVGELSFIWSTTPDKNTPPKSVISNAKLRSLKFAAFQKVSLVYPSQHWLRSSLLSHPIEGDYSTDWYVLPQQKYAHFVTNESLLLKRGYPPKKSGQWLYDRPQALYQLFIMTEDKYWLDKANAAANFYKQNIDSKGQFALTKRFDPKYLMPKGLAFQYLLNADENALATLKRVFEASLGWDESYSFSRGFWTERNQAAALNVAVTYWELTGEQKALTRVHEIIDATVKMTFNPVGDWPLRGCPQHSFKSHEGWGDNSAACSPWMMALLGDALWRFYQLTGDEKAASLIDAFGDFILNFGIYFGDDKVNNIVIPKYIVSMDNPKQEELDQWSNPQHACDVAALLGKSTYIKERNKQDSLLVKELFHSLVDQCKGAYHKLKAEKKETKYWSIMPPRRFGWMYSSTSDLPWLVDHLLD